MLSCRIRRVATVPFLLLVSGLGSCMQPGFLTRALWDKSKDTPPLARTRQTSTVHEARGRLDHGSQDNVLCVKFSTTRKSDTPKHLETFSADSPGMATLAPPGRGNGDWLMQPGAEMFQPLSWNVRMYSADYLREEAVRARLVFRGVLPTERVCRLLPEHRVSTEVREQEAIEVPTQPVDEVDRVLAAFDHHRWAMLCVDDGRWTRDYRQVPLAFVDSEGGLLTPATVRRRIAAFDAGTARRRLASYSLIARLDGAWRERVHIAIPLPVLLQGQNLQLERVRNQVVWQRQQVWTGQLTQSPLAMANLPRLKVRLQNRTFAFVHGRQQSQDLFLFDLFRVLMTPAALAADFALAHSIWFQAAIEFFRKAGPWQGPFGSRGK